MLVLSRKLGEEILIGGHIRVRVIQCGNGRVRLGVTAPREVEVLRSEIAFNGEHQQSSSHRSRGTVDAA